MPVITIKVFEGELTWGQAAELIEDVTNAVVPFVGEAVRSNVWVRIEKVTPKKIASSSYTHEPLLIGSLVP